MRVGRFQVGSRAGRVHSYPVRLTPRSAVRRVVPGVSQDAARKAMTLLREAPTLTAIELSAYLGITEHQAVLCITIAGGQW